MANGQKKTGKSSFGDLERVAILGGVRIPFARAFGAYSYSSAKDMLAASLQGLVERFDLQGVQPGEVQGGAVIGHASDFNLAREALLSTDLSPLTRGTTLKVACGTSLAADINLGCKIALGQIELGIACGVDSISDSPLMFGNKSRKRLFKFGRARRFSEKIASLKGFSPGELKPVTAGANEPRTGLTMGQHCELMAQEWQISRQDQDAFAVLSHQRAINACERGFYERQLVAHAGLLYDDNVRAETNVDLLASLKCSFEKSEKGTLTAGNSTPLTDGAASLLMCSETYARKKGLPIQAFLTHSHLAANDFVKGEGLLMAPTVAVSAMLEKAGLDLQSFDLYEIHEAFAAQVLATLKAWEDPLYCKVRLGRDAPMGAIERDKLNPVGSSLAYGHPFAATGARILSTAAQQLKEKGEGRALISICTAGGMGVAAILERDEDMGLEGS